MRCKPFLGVFSLLFSVASSNAAFAESGTINSDSNDEANNLPPSLVLNEPHATLNPSNNETYSKTPTAVDPEGNTLTFSIQNKPEWLSFDTSTGAMTGIPTAADAGSKAGIVVTVSDGVNSVSSEPFTINVLDGNGQFQLDQCYTDDFVGTGGLDSTWRVLKSQNFTPTSVIQDGQPRLRLTGTAKAQSTGVSKVFPIPAVGVNQFEFLVAAYGGINAGDGHGADGVAFVLSDWEVNPEVGVQGHGLGYSTSEQTKGFNGGWLAVGIDEWGNFSEPKRHNGKGGPGRTINSISVRGSAGGSEADGNNRLIGYDYLTGTGTLSPRLDASTEGNVYRVTLDSTTKTNAYLTVERKINGTFTTIIDRYDVLSYDDQAPLPEQFRVSFTSSTGAYSNYHDMTLLTTTGSDCASVSAIQLKPGVVNLESQTATFTASLNIEAPTGGVSVDFATTDGTALASSEYTTTAGTLNFAKGERFKQIEVPLAQLDTDDNGKNFFVRLSNSSGAFISTATAAAEFTITADNNAPIAVVDDYDVDEGRRLNGSSVLTNDTDADNNELTAALVTNVSNGTLTLNSDGTFVYVHNGSETTSDSFSYKANDGQSNSDAVTVNITVNPINEAPIALADNYLANEGERLTATSVLANDIDGDNDKSDLTAILVSDVTNGTLILNEDGTFVYSHDGSETTSDSFRYKTSDGALSSNIVTVNIAVNRTPVANTQTVDTTEDTPKSITLTGSDADGDSLTYAIVNHPTNGVLSGTGTNRTYTPNANFSGIDIFTFKVNDGNTDSGKVTVRVNVANVNDAPVANAQTVNATEDTAKAITLTGSDADGDSLTYTIVDLPTNGTLTGSGTNRSYTPNANFNGTDEFTFKVNDGNADSGTVTVKINVANVNDAPVANAQIVTTAEEVAKAIVLSATDVDGDNLTYTIIEQPSNGVLTGTGTNQTYTPNADFVGRDNFIFRVSDGNGESNTAVVTVDVSNVNDAPVASSQTVDTDEGTAKSIVLAGSDPDGDTLTFRIVSQPANGELSGTGANRTYTPNTDFVGQDSFTYRVNDGNANSQLATVTINVANVNDAPVANAQEVTTAEDTQKAIVLIGSDSDGDTLTYQLVSEPTKGRLTGTGANLTYIPDENAHGTDSFVFKVNDGQLDSEDATVSIRISPVNDAPVATDDTFTVEQDSTDNTIDVLANDSDVEGEALTIVSVSSDKGFVEVLEDGRIVYTPAPGYFGVDTIRYTVRDESGATSIATVQVTVTEAEANLPPEAIDDTITITSTEPVTIDVLANDTDPEGDELSIVSTSSDFGEVVIVEGQLRFTPEGDTSGQLVVNYTIEDTASNKASAQVLINFDNDLAPVINTPQDLCGDLTVNATGLYTRVDLGQASAVDRFGNVVPVSLVDGVSLFPPGLNQATWQATDDEGNTSLAVQNVCVMPLVSLSKDNTGAEGQSRKVGIHLNGAAPVYPVTVPYTVAGSADSDDHNLVAGEVVISSGTDAHLEINIVQDSIAETDETIEVSLSDNLNLGDKRVHTLTIIEGNIAPQVLLAVSQQNEERLIITTDGGEVSVRAQVVDANINDSHSYQWSESDSQLINASDNPAIYRFDPTLLTAGLYRIELSVTDSGIPAKDDEATVFIEVVDELPILTGVDSDGDLIPDDQEGYGDSDADGIPDYLDSIPECNVLPEQVKINNAYLVEGQAGVCLRRGQFALTAEGGGALIADLDLANENDALIEDSEAINIGGIFDYIAYGLPVQGSSYAIVMPQRNPIPEGAVYRKFNERQGWYNFVEDEANSLWSTQGEPGYCPPPAVDNDTVWTLGLTPGHWCVQMIVEDGGVNDDDGLVNGTVVDPGYVGVMKDTNTLPVAQNDSATLVINSSVTIDVLANDADEDGDTLTITSATATLGEVTIEDNQLRYTPIANYNGNAEIIYGISDGRGGSAQASVQVTVTPNNAPVVADEQSEIDQGGSVAINLLANDSDPENDVLRLVAVDNGQVQFTENGQATFTPNDDFSGVVTIMYTVEDSAGNQTQGQWLVTVVQVHEVKLKTSGGGSMGSLILLMLIALRLCNRSIIYRQQG